MSHFSSLLLVVLFLPSFSAQLTEFFFNGFTGNNTVHLYNTVGIIDNGIVQLTNTSSRETAHLLYPIPITFKSHPTAAPSSFSTAFTFAIVPDFDMFDGQSIAFTLSAADKFYWMSALPSQSSKYLGQYNFEIMGNASNHIFEVEFNSDWDSYYTDINFNHVAINLNSLISNFSVPAAYWADNGTKVYVSLISTRTIQAWIDFDSATSIVNVTISTSSSKPIIPLMSHKIDLSSVFQDSMYAGFSCSRVYLSTSHYLMGWSFNMSGPARSLPMTKLC